MTQIGHIVIGVIVIAAAIYLAIFISQRLTARKVAKWLAHKAELAEIPMRDRLVEGRKMSLTGQTLKQFQTLEDRYNKLESAGFNAIDNQANEVLYESQGLNFVKTRREMRTLQDLLANAESTIATVTQGLQDLAELDQAHKEAVKELESKYQALRKTLLSQNFNFGPAVEKLEEILGSLEDDFADFSRLTEEGDHATASGIYETLGMETTQLEERIESIPPLFEVLDQKIPAQLDEIQNSYEAMLAAGFRFVEDISDEIAAIKKDRDQNLDLLAELTLKKVAERNNQLEARIEDLYEILEREGNAQREVLANQENLRAYWHHNKRQNHDLYIELDRLNQDFVFSKDEAGLVRSWDIQLTNVDKQLTQIEKAIKKHDAIYSEMLAPQNEANERLTTIEQEQLEMWQTMQELPNLLKQTRNRVMVLTDKLRQIQRNVERQSLPGVPDSYLSAFYAANDELQRLKQQLALTRVNVDDAQRQLSIVTADMDTLKEKTDKLIEDAAVTERLVRRALDYRNHSEVVQATQQARYFYEKQYEYDRALATLGTVLENFEPGIVDTTIKIYRQEQQALVAGFQERDQ
ncbi:septation ring formation regulator EzrA [Weissella oryzae SG25]|uniref:Septation ring formation regulator EzrA n=1 Tax=Weissella oryzae (strain DSM 25784 / JCM 18191 / LMG 30913 / SG25) TaxID=1329250 RepID=A0A069CW58_WEIOS|nr:septation ring formation regulator EzrA [Weissella oryzae]GAK31622.1 septation ring formation regulator EzrA [Weissella oryzae SG25]